MKILNQLVLLDNDQQVVNLINKLLSTSYNMAEQPSGPINGEIQSLQVEDLTFRYSTIASDVINPTVLNNVNLTLPKGSRCILVGSNGAGNLSSFILFFSFLFFNTFHFSF
jgi:ABC-type multidrug transport system fused ATPase/permease subunit